MAERAIELDTVEPAGPGATQFWIAVIVLTVACWLPVLVGALTRAAVGWVLAAALAIVVERLTRRLSPAVLVSGLVIAGALVPSGLVTPSTEYLPVMVTGGAIIWRTGLEAWRARTVSVPVARPVLVALGLYLAWAALSTATSIDRRASAEYLVGMFAVCGLAFWAIPAMLVERTDRERLLITLGVLAVAVALSVYFIAVIGPIDVFGRPIADYQRTDLTLGGRATGLLFGRSAGIYLAPLEASVVMVIGLVALLGWSATRSGRPLLLAGLGIVFIVPAVLLTLDRTAWLAAIGASGAFAVLAIFAKLRITTSAVVCLFFALSFLLVLKNAVGVNAVEVQAVGPCTVNCSPSTDEVALRGGTGLSGREFLWTASVQAIEKRPLLGAGPGNNVPAIGPYLGGGGVHLQGLTSHSTWLRAAVEMGIPGCAFLIGVLGAVAWVFVRRGLGTGAIPDATQLILAASVAGLIPAMTFESFLLGGVTFSNLYLAVALGLMVGPLTPAGVSTPTAPLARL